MFSSLRRSCFVARCNLLALRLQSRWFARLSSGVLLLDRGPSSDRNENGVDPNWELPLNPPKWAAWSWLGSPDPMLGVTPNFNGDTSAFYAGLNYELSLSNRWTDELTSNLTKHLFVAGNLSAALHNGPLHKNKSDCKAESDCGFGYRVLPRLGFEIAGYFSAKQGLAVFCDHISQGDTAGRE